MEWPSLTPTNTLNGEEYFWTHIYKVIVCPYDCHPNVWPYCFQKHSGEIGRRNPLLHGPTPCRYQNCPWGDTCWFAHNILEKELHPESFRTTYCSNMAACNARPCFHAHNPYELRKRRQPENASSDGSTPRVVREAVGGVMSDAADDSHFWMYEYKIKMCSQWHLWQGCLYAHEGEAARRRDPASHTATLCHAFWAGHPCPRGNRCTFAHNRLERGLHPNFFRTRNCMRADCTMTPCFYAHSEEQLRHVT